MTRDAGHYTYTAHTPQVWRANAACYGQVPPQLFDYSDFDAERAQQAAAVCAGCPVQNAGSPLVTPSSGDCETFHDGEQKRGMPLHTVAAGFVYTSKRKKPLLAQDLPVCGNPICGRSVPVAVPPAEQRKFCSYECLVYVRRTG